MHQRLKLFLSQYPDTKLYEPKHEFRWLCFKHLPEIRAFPLPADIPTESKMEAVLVEFRKFPHLEFTLRNTILKLGSAWSYSVLCGTDNYEFVKELASSIHPSIRVIKTPYENLDMSLYSVFFSSLDLWETYLRGEKILIYQEDSMIFRSGIDEFLEWDYIGAPWGGDHSNAPIHVGNGGFSLRTRQTMIDVIKACNSKEIEPTETQKVWMRFYNSPVIPEDSYFSYVMQTKGIGKLPPESIASRFSIESVYNPDSLGGHAFWLCDKEWRSRFKWLT